MYMYMNDILAPCSSLSFSFLFIQSHENDNELQKKKKKTERVNKERMTMRVKGQKKRGRRIYGEKNTVQRNGWHCCTPEGLKPRP